MIPVPEAVRKIAIWDAIYVGRAQADGTGEEEILRSRIRDYPNHEVLVEKHPHTGRVLRTTRRALAVNVLGRWVWMSAPEAMLDGFFDSNDRLVHPWTFGADRWFVALTEGRAHVNVLPSRK